MRNGYRITKDKFFSPQEARHLLKVCSEKAIVDQIKGRKTWVARHMLIHLALNSGLRVSEIANLTIGDLKLTGKETYLIVQHGKGDRKRDVYLDKEIVLHLRSYISQDKVAWNEPTDYEAPLLTGRNHGHYTTTALEISFKQALKLAGLPNSYSIHSSRHTYATILLSKTNNLRFVQKQLGHASINMTALYADVLPVKDKGTFMISCFSFGCCYDI